jgi:hypothetical protein
MRKHLLRDLAIGTAFGALISVPILMTGCAWTQANSDVVTQTLTQLTNTAVTDLATTKMLALAATPPDADGAQCADAATVVAQALQKLAAAQKGQVVGALSAAEFASLVQPGSAQFNWAVKTLETGCIAKIHDVNQAINSTAGIMTALPAILGLAALPVGA